jgi:hypothetical protein
VLEVNAQDVGASLLVGTINENLPSATSRARYYLPYPSRYFSGSRINRFAMPYSQRPGFWFGNFVTTWHSLFQTLFDPYRPELHYMRGPGPKWHAKHGIL